MARRRVRIGGAIGLFLAALAATCMLALAALMEYWSAQRNNSAAYLIYVMALGFLIYYWIFVSMVFEAVTCVDTRCQLKPRENLLVYIDDRENEVYLKNDVVFGFAIAVPVAAFVFMLPFISQSRRAMMKPGDRLAVVTKRTPWMTTAANLASASLAM